MGTILKLPKNNKGRDFVVGDIHGCFFMLEEALKLVNFDPKKDRVIAVGDLINRGPESDQVRAYLTKPWFFAVQGNHEIGYIHKFEKDGRWSDKTIKGRLGQGFNWMVNMDRNERAKIRKALQDLPVIIEVETEKGDMAFMHADINESNYSKFRKKIKNGDHAAIYAATHGQSRLENGNNKEVEGIKRIFFGHKPTCGGVKRFGNCYYIDTGACINYTHPGRFPLYSMTLAEITSKNDDLLSDPAPGNQVRGITRKSGVIFKPLSDKKLAI